MFWHDLCVIFDGQGKSCAEFIELLDSDENLLLDEAMQKKFIRESALFSAAEKEQKIYGVSTNLGHGRRGEQKQLENLFDQVIDYGRDHSQQEISPYAARLAIPVRIHMLVSGASGISPWIVDDMVTFYNSGFIPRIFAAYSVGSADLGEMGQLARILMRMPEEEFYDGDKIFPANAFPGNPGNLCRRDPLALVSSNAFSLAQSIEVLQRACAVFDYAQRVFARSLVFIRGNPSPFAPGVMQLRRIYSEQRAAENIFNLFSSINTNPEPQDVQDPLSFRSVGSVHGTVLQSIWDLSYSLEEHLASSGDNPCLDASSGEVFSNAHFDTTQIAHRVDGLSQSLVRLAYLVSERITKLTWPEYNTHFQEKVTVARSREAYVLLSEIRAKSFMYSDKFSGDVAYGVEDWSSFLPQSNNSCLEIIKLLFSLLRLEAKISGEVDNLPTSNWLDLRL